MKNFLDLLDIEITSALNVKILFRATENIDYYVKINEYAITSQNFQCTLDLLTPIVFIFNIRDINEGEYIEIIEFSINGIELFPIYQHLSSNGSNFIAQTGSWSFKIDRPFYQWYHQISGQGWLLTPGK